MTEVTSNSVPTTMRAAVAARAGGPEVFEWQQAPVPAPGDGDILVRTAAAGLNFIETYQRGGVYPVEYPAVLGSEASGTVVAVGSAVTTWQPGDRVMTAAANNGTYAEYFTAPANECVRVPDSIDLVEAAAIPLQGGTAHYLANSIVPLKAGDTALVHAGAGGVGLLLTQLLTDMGVRVFTTAGSPEKQQLSRDAGAAEVLDYDGFADRVRELTDGEGVTAVFDGVGKSTFDDSLKATRVRGMVCIFGGSSGQVAPLDVQRLNAGGSLFVTRPKLQDYMLTAEERTWRYGDLATMVAEGRLKLCIGQKVSLANVADAHRALESRATTGKTLLVPGE